MYGRIKTNLRMHKRMFYSPEAKLTLVGSLILMFGASTLYLFGGTSMCTSHRTTPCSTTPCCSTSFAHHCRAGSGNVSWVKLFRPPCKQHWAQMDSLHPGFWHSKFSACLAVPPDFWAFVFVYGFVFGITSSSIY
jgi:hypothetical protein